MFRTKNILAASIAAVMAATTAHAATVVPPQPPTLVGGGATLPAIAYVGSSWLTNNIGDVGVANRLSITNANVVAGATGVTPATANTNSLFGQFALGTTTAIENITTNDNGTVSTLTGTKAVKTANPNVSYCQTGSGGGRNVLEGVAAATGSCTDYSTSPTGFSAPIDAQFAASDAPLLASDYTTFITNRGATKTEPVQFPAIAGAIAVVYNGTGTGLSGTLNLTEAQICQVFSGQVATWGALLGTTNTTPITVVYRNDNSGTSFNFSNHLAKVCAADGVSGVFTTNSNFSSNSKGSTTPNSTFADNNFYPQTAAEATSSGLKLGSELISGTNAPVTAVGENGNGAVVGEVNNTAGAIGYAEVADAKARAEATGASINYATVSIQANTPITYYCSAAPTTTSLTKLTCSGKGNKLVTVKAQTFKAWDPIVNFPKSVKVAFSSDKVLVSSATGAELETLAAASITPTHAGCVQVVDPANIAIPTLAKGDYTQYPIEAVTYLMGFNTGNSVTVDSSDSFGKPLATTTDVHSFVAALISSAYSIGKGVTTIGAGTGFAALVPTLDSGAAGGTKKPATLVTNCVLQ